MDRRPGVLFLCVHNAGRSQMAAAYARRMAGDRARIYSGGSEPASSLNPAVVEAMREDGIPLDGEAPKRWSDDEARGADVIVTMGCGDTCPVYPGVRIVDWELPDPAGQTVEVVRTIRDDIRVRVAALLAELGVPAAPDDGR